MTLVEVTCYTCGKKFQKSLKNYNNAIKAGRRHSCSLKCNKKTVTTQIKKCDWCGKEHKKEINQVNRSKHLFCSHRCFISFTRFCFTCNKPKKKHKNGAYKGCYICPTCKKEKGHEYYEDHKEYICKRQSKYNLEHKEERAESKKKWAKKNAERLKKKRKEERERNKDKWATYNKEYRKKHKKELAIKSREYRQKNRKKIMKKAALDLSKRRARRKGLPCEYSAKDLRKSRQFTDYKCIYCNKKSSKTLHKEHLIPEAFNAGFIPCNILPACESCNLTKNDKFWFDFADKRSILRIEKWLNRFNKTDFELLFSTIKEDAKQEIFYNKIGKIYLTLLKYGGKIQLGKRRKHER